MEKSYDYSKKENFMDRVKELAIGMFVFMFLLGYDIIYEVIFQKTWGSPTLSVRGLIVKLVGVDNIAPESDIFPKLYVAILAFDIIVLVTIKIHEFIENRKNR